MLRIVPKQVGIDSQHKLGEITEYTVSVKWMHYLNAIFMSFQLQNHESNICRKRIIGILLI